MKTRLFGITAIGSIVASAMVAMTPLMVQASELKTTTAATNTAQSEEIAQLKQQIYMCQHHKRHRHHATVSPVAQVHVIEKQVIVEKPVYVDREKIVEKQVFVDRAADIAVKTEVVQTPVALMDERVIVKHSAHRTHLLHFGIPLISLNLF